MKNKEEKIDFIKDLELRYDFGPKDDTQCMSPFGAFLDRLDMLDVFKNFSKKKVISTSDTERVENCIKEYYQIIEPAWEKFRRRLFLPKLMLNLVFYFVFFGSLWFLVETTNAPEVFLLAMALCTFFFLGNGMAIVGVLIKDFLVKKIKVPI